jgi:hypothetical protein
MIGFLPPPADLPKHRKSDSHSDDIESDSETESELE